MKLCYIVQGNTGEYEDYVEWIFKVFLSKENANQITDLLNARLCNNKAHRNQGDIPGHSRYSEEHKRISELFLEIDPGFRLDYTGTNYKIVEAYLSEEE